MNAIKVKDKLSMIVPMTIEYASQISNWTYENEYSIYNFEKNRNTIQELMNGDYWVYLDSHDELTGYFCFGKSAQIPTVEENPYDPEFLDICLGMKPALCGKGEGYAFVKSELAFAGDQFNAGKFRLTVSAFNSRAIRVYSKIGFHVSQKVTHGITKSIFLVMITEKLI